MSNSKSIQVKKNKLRRSFGDNAFLFLSYFFVIVLCLAALYPIIYVVSASLSSSKAVMKNEVVLWPVGFTTQAYNVVLLYKGIWSSFFNSVFYTVAGTFISIVMTILAAYPLSKKHWGPRKMMNLMIVFTMWFGGGMIPFFLLMKGLNLLDNRFGILIYGAISAFYVIIFRTHFESIPDSLEESAKIEGANDMQILLSIMIPLSKPVISAIALYYAVGKWNSFFWETILLSSPEKQPLQVLLQRIVSASQLEEAAAKQLSRGEQTTPQTIKFAAIVFTSLPIVIVYPFLQKYFVAGTLTGAVKG